MRVTKVFYFIHFLLVLILLESYLCHERRNKSNLIFKNSPFKNLNEKREKKEIYGIVGIVAATLGITLSALGYNYFRRKKKSLWQDLGDETDTILNNTIKCGIYEAKKKIYKEICNVKKLSPSLDEVRAFVEEQFRCKNLDINNYDQRQLDDLCTFALYNIRQSVINLRKNLMVYSQKMD
ncbi:early transcribed membrane protein [Plasmodium brasilianum]|uniref:Early transcribed membrane protein n=2 Tax=Plasmodium (Plasmodium) TaxID=418103 RepID=A0A1A8X0K6_PLAMA|nr:early transcribed membrane protein [Plasmodium malariae]KAI4836908.1 early transcribed membrane protein [Plasmodium brasilianum]SBS97208.1 early transcribed membrane protein [Plasmodium malariae]SCO94210.1 early transcribed membrane protein [Plasmodium malariae]